MLKLRLMLLGLGLALSALGNEASKSVAQAEYFWGADPGPGLGVPFPAADGALDEAVESLFKSGVVPPSGAGPRAFHARVKDPNGNWSAVFTTIVHVASGENNPPRSTKVVMAEYFWDTDPGQGAGTPLAALDGALDETIESVVAAGIPVPSTTGGHTFNVRVKDADGQWGPLFTTVVAVFTPAGPPAAGVAQAEYFWDIDPGPGNGTPLNAADGSLNESVEALVSGPVAVPGAFGARRFHVRAKDAAGVWGPVFQTVVHSHIGNGSIYVYDGDDDGDTMSNLLEYFLGTDPGQRDDPADHLSWGFEPVPGGNGESRLFVEVRRNHVATDAVLEPEVSANLTDWHGVDDGWVVAHPATPGVLRFHTAQDLEGKPKFFFRLTVTMVPP